MLMKLLFILYYGMYETLKENGKKQYRCETVAASIVEITN